MYELLSRFDIIIIFRILLAGVLGGIIGYEREITNRPAGFRTHILVCLGSALVMTTSEYIFDKYKGFVNIDPARLGAQVISGIGFLGAGTIIRDGISIRGLTTAASLWAVSCVGIAVGIGFYEGAVAAVIVIIITLISLRGFEEQFAKKRQLSILYVQTENMPGQIGLIGSVFGKHNIITKNIEFTNNDSDKDVLMKFVVKLPANVSRDIVLADLQKISGVQKVYDE